MWSKLGVVWLMVVAADLVDEQGMKMTVTVLVYANEKWEQPVLVGCVRVGECDPNVGLDKGQVRWVLDLLADDMKAQRVSAFADVRLLYQVDGVPASQQRWSVSEVRGSLEDYVPLHPGFGLFLDATVDMKVRVLDI